MYSILHISDLHRSPEEPTDTDSLIAALVVDCDRCKGETPIVPAPNAIIVSGDLILGAPTGYAKWQETVRKQYDVANDFLDKLAQRFLNGDRSSLIIVPGNHDVCWNTSFNSMVRVEPADYPEDIRTALVAPDTLYRWSWKERALYRIQDPDLYRQRLDAFWKFSEAFYAGVSLLKPIDRNRGYQLFELNNRRIIVAAFDSTYGNDCFSYSGSIARGTVARCNLSLRDAPHAYELKLAVWHHSVQGVPLHDDFMDVGHVHEMIGLGFQLGLHGHQHLAAATTHYVHLSESQAMAVVSAGSLCAGARELPRGINRQYTIITIDDDYRHARVHVREMVEGEQFTRKNNGAFVQGYAEITWQASTDSAGRAIDAQLENDRRATLAAEAALQSNKLEDALAALKNTKLSEGSYARVIAVQAALRAANWPFLARIIDPPHTREEAAILVSALTKMNSLDQASIILKQQEDLDAGTRAGLEEQIAIKRMMNGI